MTPLRFKVYDIKGKTLEYEGDDLALIGDQYQNVPIDNLGEQLQYSIVQSTGLRDKNGKEIFEGDVLKRNGMVEYREGSGGGPEYAGCWVGYAIDEDCAFEQDEILGNIYETPNLIKP